MNGSIRVQLFNERKEFILRRARIQPVFASGHAGGFRRLAFARDIDMRRRIITHEDNGEARNLAGFFLHHRHPGRDPFAQAGGESFAVNDLRRHSTLLNLAFRLEINSVGPVRPV